MSTRAKVDCLAPKLRRNVNRRPVTTKQQLKFGNKDIMEYGNGSMKQFPTFTMVMAKILQDLFIPQSEAEEFATLLLPTE